MTIVVLFSYGLLFALAAGLAAFTVKLLSDDVVTQLARSEVEFERTLRSKPTTAPPDALASTPEIRARDVPLAPVLEEIGPSRLTPTEIQAETNKVKLHALRNQVAAQKTERDAELDGRMLRHGKRSFALSAACVAASIITYSYAPSILSTLASRLHLVPNHVQVGERALMAVAAILALIGVGRILLARAR